MSTRSHAQLAANQPSLSIASLPRKCVAFAFGTKVIIGRYLTSDEDLPNPLNSVVIDDGQLVRDVAFLRIPDGPLCLVTGGDSKFINVYNISSWKSNNPDAFNISSSDDDEDAEASATEKEGGEDKSNSGTATRQTTRKRPPPRKVLTKNDVEAKKWVPSFQYGPHNKRISRVVATDEGSIIFADKFGEVYRLQLTWSPAHTIEVEGDAKVPNEFLLQHFSVLSTLFISSPVPRLDPIARSEVKDSVACRRLFTCDRDRHARVSRYPEAYQVEQFLWTKTNDQSVVTCVTEIPYLSDEDFSFPGTRAANKHNRKLNAPYSYYCTGYQDGHINFWAAYNDLPMDSPAETFHCFATFRPETDLGAVVSVVYLAQDLDMTGNRRHPRDTPRGVVVAYEKSKDVFFYPVFDSVGQYGMHASKVGGTVATLPDFPVAMIQSSDSTALAVVRDGSVVFTQLVEDGYLDEMEKRGDRPKLCSFNANIFVAIEVKDEKMPYLEEKIASAVTSGGKNALADLDLSAQWRSEVSDPRTRKHGKSDESDDGNEDDGDSPSPEKKRARPQRK